MKGLNRAYLMGNVGQKPEVRVTATGQRVTKVSLATPFSEKIGDEWIEKPDWHRLTAYDDIADYLAKYADRGSMMAVECTIKPSKWVDEDNITHYEVNLIIDRVLWLK
jgi:single-strand DNA-binding protein